MTGKFVIKSCGLGRFYDLVLSLKLVYSFTELFQSRIQFIALKLCCPPWRDHMPTATACFSHLNSLVSLKSLSPKLNLSSSKFKLWPVSWGTKVLVLIFHLLKAWQHAVNNHRNPKSKKQSHYKEKWFTSRRVFTGSDLLWSVHVCNNQHKSC